MRTIEEVLDDLYPLAKGWDVDVHSIDDNEIARYQREGFIAGAQFEREELTRWNNPDDILPPDEKNVIIKIYNSRARVIFYAIGCVFGNEWDTDADTQLALCNPENKILGWREIYE